MYWGERRSRARACARAVSRQARLHDGGQPQKLFAVPSLLALAAVGLPQLAATHPTEHLRLGTFALYTDQA